MTLSKQTILVLITFFGICRIYGSETHTRHVISAEEAATHLIESVAPESSPLGPEARLRGDVVLRIVIDKQRNVVEVRYLRGSPLLIQSAIEAVRQWRYRPFFVKHRRVMVETTITVPFRPAG